MESCVESYLGSSVASHVSIYIGHCHGKVPGSARKSIQALVSVLLLVY